MEAHFIVVSPTARTDGKFLIKSIASTSGRFDVICRCALSLMGQPGNETEEENEEEKTDANDTHNPLNVFGHFLLLGPPNSPLWIHFDPKPFEKETHDEITLAGHFQELIQQYVEKNEESSSDLCLSEGVKISRESFSDFIDNNQFDRYIMLSENGEQITPTFFSNLNLNEKWGIFLGSQLDVPLDLKELVHAKGAKEVSVGKLSYLASHVIVIVKHLLLKKGTLIEKNDRC